jgi:hypothetical protein
MTETGEAPTTSTISDANMVFNSSVVDSSDNIYVSGKYSSYSAGWNPAGLLSKYNSSGALQWAIKIDGSSGSEVGNGIDVDVTSTGNSYIGITSFTSPNYTLYFLKYNSSGVRQWVRSLAGAGSYQAILCNIVDTSGNLYTLIRRGNDGVVVKMDSTGTNLWNKTFNVTGVEGWNSAMSISNTTLYVGVDSGFISLDTSTGDIITQRALNMDPSTVDIVTTQFDSLGNVYCLAYMPGTPSAALVYSFDSSGNLRYCNRLTQDTTYPVDPLLPTGMVYKDDNLYITLNNTNYDLIVMKVPAKGTVPGKGVYIMPLNGLSATYTFNYHPYSVSGTTTTYTATSTSLTFGTTGLTDSTLSVSSDPLSLVWTRKVI